MVTRKEIENIARKLAPYDIRVMPPLGQETNQPISITKQCLCCRSITKVANAMTCKECGDAMEIIIVARAS